MSFSVTVTPFKPLSIDDLPDDIDSQDILLTQEQKNVFYEEPLAADSAFYRFWHTPAMKLDLSLSSKIYNFGFSSSEAEKINDLKQEVITIQLYWEKEGIAEDERYEFSERLAYFLRAIEIALEHQAYLTVS